MQNFKRAQTAQIEFSNKMLYYLISYFYLAKIIIHISQKIQGVFKEFLRNSEFQGLFKCRPLRVVFKDFK